ncbi:MAG: riboflavin synthase, partial [Gammaproteobacteria bacterium]
MFTGIIIATGRVTDIAEKNGDSSISIETGDMRIDDVDTGDSICVNGVCLTVVSLTDSAFTVDVSAETLDCTTIGALTAGSMVNLEKALRIGDRLDGHLVTGHVDGTGIITSLKQSARSWECQIEAPEELTPYLCRKGSICVDGVSLTVNDVSGRTFSISVIPHTMTHTIFNNYEKGSRVNLEVDIIAR